MGYTSSRFTATMSTKRIALVGTVAVAAALVAIFAYKTINNALSDPCDRVPQSVLDQQVGDRRMGDILNAWQAAGEGDRRRLWCEEQQKSMKKESDR